MEQEKNRVTIPRPDETLEETHLVWAKKENRCHGRGKQTAAKRGYTVEKLAELVFGARGPHTKNGASCYDRSKIENEVYCLIESKSCINRYASGSYGSFRIWKTNHSKLQTTTGEMDDKLISFPYTRVYFFVVYCLEMRPRLYTERGDTDEKLLPKEVGKVVVDVETVDEIVQDRFFEIDHPTMGKTEVADISWNLLLTELGVSTEDFEDETIINAADDLTIDRRDLTLGSP